MKHPNMNHFAQPQNHIERRIVPPITGGRCGTLLRFLLAKESILVTG